MKISLILILQNVSHVALTDDVVKYVTKFQAEENIVVEVQYSTASVNSEIIHSVLLIARYKQ